MVRLWSKKHYNSRYTKEKRLFHGSITSAKSKKMVFFNSAGAFLLKLEKLYEEDEKRRRR
jgi:hypothetical protein